MLKVAPISSLLRKSIQDKLKISASTKLRQMPTMSVNKIKYQYSDLTDLPELWKNLENTLLIASKKFNAEFLY